MTKSATIIRTEWANSNPLLTDYYDNEWGMPVYGEQEVFERLCLESFQSGLSWLIVLRKREALREAFAGFNPDLVANFDDKDVERLLENPNIIRNKLKINSVITNAAATIKLRESKEFNGLPGLLWSFMPETSPVAETLEELPTYSEESEAMTKVLKKHGFKFVGPTTLYAAMAAIGIVDAHVVGSHRRGCSKLWNVDGTKLKNPGILAS